MDKNKTVSPGSPQQVKRICSIGAGPIGAGWSAYFLAAGYEVNSYIHQASEEASLRALIDNAWISLTELGLAEAASLDKLKVTTDLITAVQDVDFVQESAPEDLSLKQNLFKQLGEILPPNIVIASSTSGLPMTDIQQSCATPERTVVGHPFNPPYLMPLVEIVKGNNSSQQAVDWLVAFYRHAGKAPLVLSREIPGFIATRLQEALWREALHMVENKEATVEEIDFAIVNGPGPRWAHLGPCMTFHIGGGEGGMAYNLDHFGPALKLPWTRLEAPELTQSLRDELVEGCDRQAAGRDYITLLRERDSGLVAVMKAIRECNDKASGL
ncbi:MAG: 3-hydroxyacyl-CoA dehydrogenase NAD-binding domain-containing protein [Pseudohongiellaceae bacterium]